MEINQHNSFYKIYNYCLNNKVVCYLNKKYTYICEFVNNRENISVRIFYACLPYLYYNSTFSKYYNLKLRFFSVISKSKNAYADIGDLIKNVREKGATKEVAIEGGRFVLDIAFFVYCFFNPHTGWILSNCISGGKSLYKAFGPLKNKEYQQAASGFYKSFSCGATVAHLLRPDDLNLRIASKALELISQVESTHEEIKKKHRIETVSKLGLIGLASQSLLPDLKQLHHSFEIHENFSLNKDK